jgi:hypothetical protein
MASIDGLSWTAGVAFMTYGLRIGVRVTDPSVLGAVVEYLPPGWKPVVSPEVDRLYSLLVDATGRRRDYRLYRGPCELVHTTSLSAILDQIQADMHLYVAEFARRRLFVHAGAVGWQGQAIIIAGASMSGKSTLVASLLHAGATYYSDEYAVLDFKGRVHPFARPLSVRDDGARRQRRVQVELLGSVGTEPLRVGLVALLHYRHGEQWRPTILSAGPAVLGLLANTIAARRRPGLAFRTLGEVVSRATVLQGARGEASETAQQLLNTVSRNRYCRSAPF